MKIASPFRITYISLFCLVVFAAFGSCKKDSINQVIIGEARIKLINASQGSSSIDFYLNDSKINSSALGYGEESEYIKITSGNKIAKINNGTTIAEVAGGYNFVPTFSYTAFFVEDKAGKGEILTFEDNLGAIESDKSRIRFINLSPNLTNSLNISLTGGQLLVNDLAFKEASSYFMVQAGTSVGVAVVGTGVLKIESGNEFEGGKNYTIWISGTSNANFSINKITYN